MNTSNNNCCKRFSRIQLFFLVCFMAFGCVRFVSSFEHNGQGYILKQDVSIDSVSTVIAPSPKTTHAVLQKKTTVSKLFTDTLADWEMPVLPEGLVIVNPDKKGIRFVNAVANNLLVIAIPYDRHLIPEGYTVADIIPFRYDELTRQWEMMDKDGVDPEKDLLYSRIHSDGVMINGIIKRPELPQTNAYTPTKIRDLKLADPGANIQLIAPPVANQYGSAQLSYNIEIPKGRAGMQPALQLTYNSDGGNGILGEGWNLSISSITIETRWGVPRYEKNIETETYLLDGEMLAMENEGNTTTAHRNITIPRIKDRHFYPRKQKEFKTIIRHENDPGDYWWEIVDRKGTHFFYGKVKVEVPQQVNNQGPRVFRLDTDPTALLRTNKGVAEWKLTYVEDVFGNYMRYLYTQDPINYNGQDRVVQIVPKAISYTGYNNEDKSKGDRLEPAYQVLFNYDNTARTDMQTSARLGVLATSNAVLISEVTVLHDRISMGAIIEKNIRKYRFSYETGPFNKKLLTGIAQLGKDDALFNEHKFHYNNPKLDNQFFEEATDWANNGPVVNGNNRIAGRFDNTLPTDLGSSRSEGSGFSFYSGFGWNDQRFTNKSLTAGVTFGNNNSESKGITTLIDVDGDNLPDKLIANIRLQYMKNTGSGFAAAVDIASEVSNFSVEKSNTQSTGVSASFGIATAGRERSTTNTDITTYFSDVNADGLIDIVKDGMVYFNKLVNGAPNFALANNTMPASVAGNIQVQDTIDYDDKSTKIAAENPLHDVVRVWVAPIDGRVNIEAPVNYIPFIPDPNSDEQKLADGVTVSIQKEKQELWRLPIAKDDGGIHTPPAAVMKNIEVKKNERIFFRLMSGVDNLSNGSLDKVNWAPKIEYTHDGTTANTATDMERKDIFRHDLYKYDIRSDLLYSSEAGVQIPLDTTCRIELPFYKGITSDDIRIEITEYTEDMSRPVLDDNGNPVRNTDGSQAFEYHASRSLVNVILKSDVRFKSLPIGDVINEPLVQKGFYHFKVSADVGTNFDSVRWAPVIYIPKRQDASFAYGAQTHDTLFVIPHFVMNNSQINRGDYWHAFDTTRYLIKPFIKFKKNTDATDEIWFAVRKKDSILTKVKLGYKEGILETPVLDSISVDRNDEVFASFETSDGFLFQPNPALKNKEDNILETHYIISEFNDILPRIQDASGETYTIPIDGRYILRRPLVFKAIPGNSTIHFSWVVGPKTSNGTLDFKNTDSLQLSDTIDLRAGTKISLHYFRPPPAPGGIFTPLLLSELKTYKVEVSLMIPGQYWRGRTNMDFGHLYRNWGQFIYNEKINISKKMIEVNDLKTPAIDGDRQRVMRANVENQVSENYTGEVNTGGLSELDVKKRVFSKLTPYRDQQHIHWKGMDEDIFLDTTIQSSSRAGIKHVKVTSPFLIDPPPGVAAAVAGPVTRAIIKRMSSENRSWNVGYGIGVSKASGNTETYSDFMDMNGDNHPDILSYKEIQYTNPDGSYSAMKESTGNFRHRSANSNTGGHIGGSYPLSPNGTANTNPQPVGSSVKATQQNAVSASQGTQESSASFSPSLGISTGTDQSSTTWLDINGDGLPDKVTANGNSLIANLNLGYTFSKDAISFIGMSYLNQGYSINGSPGLSLAFNNGNSSISGGLGVSLSRTLPEKQMIDVNGDGLVDKVEVSGTNLVFHINTGNGFKTNTVANVLTETSGSISLPDGKWNRSFNASSGASLGGSFTFGFPVPAPFPPFPPIFKIVFGPGINKSIGIGMTLRQFYDINADGYPDLLYSDKQGLIRVRLSRIGVTNKLEKVEGPLGATYTINYKHTTPDDKHPGGKWVMAEVIIDDGVEKDRSNPAATCDSKKSFDYKNGVYDRYERTFLGFGQVVTNEHDFDNSIVRKTEQIYNNTNYYTADNLAFDIIKDGNGKKFVETQSSYHFFYNATGVGPLQTTNTQQPFNGSMFVPLKYSINRAYEGQADGIALNGNYYEYDELGNNTLFRFGLNDRLKADGSGVFDYEVEKKFLNTKTPAGIFGLPLQYQISNGSVTLREGKANYTKEGYLQSDSVRLNAKEWAETKYEYTHYGDVQKMLLPDGQFYVYQYDDKVRTYIDRITDSHGYFSIATYDLKFGVPVLNDDINKMTTKTDLDNFGRVIRVWSPMRLQTLSPTIDVSYDPANPNHAELTQRDNICFNADCEIKIHAYVDGLNRVIQIKKKGLTTDHNGTSTDKWIAGNKNIYDAVGQIVQKFDPVADINPALNLDLPDANGPVVYKFDVLNRMLTVDMNTNVRHSSNNYSLEGNLLRTQTTLHNTPEKKQVRLQYTNGSGQVVKTVLKDNPQDIVTEFVYDGIDQLLRITDPRGVSTQKDYDYGGRLTRQTSKDYGVVNFEYNRAGNMTKKTLPGGETIGYDYKLDQLQGIRYSKNPMNNVQYIYGDASDPARLNGAVGRLYYKIDGTGVERYKYDELGNVITVDKRVAIPLDQSYHFNTSFEYDDWNRIRSITYPDAVVVKYEYDKAGELTKVNKGADEIVSKIGYNEMGNRTYCKYGNGSVTLYSYDKRNRLDRLQTDFTGKQSLAIYHYDNQDNIDSLFDQYDNKGYNQRFQYNHLGQLSQASSTWEATTNFEQKFAYDAAFNIRQSNLQLHSPAITRKIHNEMTLEQSSNRIATATEKTDRSNKANPELDKYYVENNSYLYKFDEQGNNTVTNKGFTEPARPVIQQRQIKFDEENRVNAISIDGFVSNYFYDDKGERVIKLSTQTDEVYVQGQPSGQKIRSATFSLYVNPYFSTRNGLNAYTRHIYIGTQRIMSEQSVHVAPANDVDCKPNIAGTCFPISIDWQAKQDSIKESVNKAYAYFDLSHDPLSSKGIFSSIGLKSDLPVNPANVETTAATPVQVYYHPNHLGSVNYVSNQAGKVVQHFAYLPYGQTFMEFREGYASQFKFIGKEQDRESGLSYFGARYFDPAMGNWLSVDPMSDKYPGVSPYNYCLGNPVLLMDADGNEVTKADMLSRSQNYQNYQDKFANSGSESRWAGAASKVAKGAALGAYPSAFGVSLRGFSDFSNVSSPELRKFFQEGNTTIYNDMQPRLQALLSKAPLKGSDAINFDIHAVWNEQSLIQGGIDKLSPEALAIFNATAKQAGLLIPLGATFNDYSIMPFPESGNISDLVQRFCHGLRLMGREKEIAPPFNPNICTIK